MKSRKKPPKAGGKRPDGKPMRSVRSDPLGSYTGTPADGERPQQDADDL